MNMKIFELVSRAHENAVKHGFWNPVPSFGDAIALIHSELSEALEEYRKGNKASEIYYTDKYGTTHGQNTSGQLKPEGIPIELADCIIRILDFCGKEDIDIEGALRIKHEYNKTRPYRHGGKVM